MSYKSCFVQPLKDNNYKVHLWDDGGYQTMVWNYHAYEECGDHDANRNIRGLNERWQRKHYRVDWTNGKFRNKAYPEEDVEYYKWMLEEYKLEKAQPQSR